MDSELGNPTENDIWGGSNTLNLNNERLDCEHLDELTDRYIDPNRPSFVTVLLRFFGNIFVDCFRAVFS
ncbi:uncharacterized protein LOC133843426 [Drosophila sulfurigaster albostrigata]|uniref:Uncharacterized protein LOC117571252 n=1 Tax=Drosophila albomicans TaxID=7291 RepID=A0A6P8XAV5_DROAB|nr:uncharacterized protein LOC117571252 [Drosophila albomicans]XP_060657911.1 uncharacterized protein LOC132792516 [Drosophila nasuta]XP_062132944.1 uncharacterized protein LOC133843426 [Drosophila sulfurigaster albostrigata]XP_062132945.1 uncharacterized protein LOC133843426 [Drosophila sulfurigaster albostrigata]XP_062132946.1 uncharacterized protein LOC133843426 [Drosophila sulfurigaster albostrigata]